MYVGWSCYGVVSLVFFILFFFIFSSHCEYFPKLISKYHTNMQQEQYYEPVNVFRQPAILRKTRGAAPVSNNLARTWQNNAKKIDYSNLRRVSDDYNDWYTTKKLQSDYWPASQVCSGEAKESIIPVDIAVNNNNDKLAVVTGGSTCEKNLSLLQLDGGRRLSPDHKIRKLQRVSVPKAPITQVEFVEFHNPRSTGDLLLTAHQDGAVNLINTSAESSEIVRRYNHAKYMQYSDSALSHTTSLANATPIRQLAMNTSSQNSFMSLINESLFFYDIDNGKTPTYLNHFPQINSFAQLQDGTCPLVSLATTTGLAFLDVREADAPRTYNIGGKVLASEWLDQYTIATGGSNTDTVKIFDLRMFRPELSAEGIVAPMSVCTLPANSSIRAMKFDQLNRKLFCLDDMGSLSNWDFDTKPCTRRILKNGLQTVNSKFTNDANTLECGDMMVRSGDITSIALWKGAVIGMGHREISVHRVIDITQSLHELAASNARATSAPELICPTREEDVGSQSDDTDATSVFDSTNEDDQLDNSTIKLISMSPTKGASTINDSTYTLGNLSCQTIVNTTTVA